MAPPLLKAIDALDDEKRAVLLVDAGRIDGMTDELGQEAMWSVAKDMNAFGQFGK